MKKISLCAVLVLAISLLFATFASAESSGSCGKNATWRYDEENAVLSISGTGETNNYNVTSLPERAGLSGSFSVVIEEGITSIGNNMFARGNISSVSLPSTLTKIEDKAFFESKVEEIAFPEGIESIGKSAFQNCKSLRKADNFERIRRFGVSAFSGCENLVFEKLTLKKGAEYAERSFSGVAVYEAEYVEGFKETGNYLFSGCKQLKKVVLPSTVTRISLGTFKDCEALEDINLSESVKVVDEDAFKNCGFTSVTIRSKTGYYISAYSDCKKLKEAVFEGSRTYVMDSLFSGCSALERVVLPSAVTKIGKSSFAGCTSLNDIDLSNITKIESEAFSRCCSLEEVDLSKVRTIESDAFLGCHRLRQVNTDSINNWASIDFENEYANPVYYAKSIFENNKPVLFADFSSAYCIKPYAFVNCSSLASVRFPDNIGTIGDSAFSGCSRLKTVIIDKQVGISRTAFDKCSALRNFIDFGGKYDPEASDYTLPETAKLYTAEYHSTYESFNIRYELLKNYDCGKDGHKYVNGLFELHSAPTCTEKGQADYKCIFCGKVKWNSVGKTGHIFSRIKTEAASAEADGKAEERCVICKAEREIAIFKIAEPEFKNGGVLSRKLDGNRVRDLLVIKDSAGEEIDGIYWFVSGLETSATCGTVKITFTGNYSGTVEKSFLIVPEKIDLKVGEAGENSLKLVWEKPVYSKETPVEVFISEDGENFRSLGKTTEDSMTADSLNEGTTYYFKAVASNENGCGEIAYLTASTKKHFHTPVLKKTESKTCLKSGMSYYECKTCQKEWSEVIKATGHNWKLVKTVLEPTCISTGRKEYECKDCGKKLSKTVSFSDHKAVSDPLVPATARADGKTKGSHCSVCGEIIKSQKTIRKIGRIWIKTDYEYDGYVHKPHVSVYDADGEEIGEANYTVKYSSKSPKKIGTYTVTVTFKLNYSGTKVLKFKIVPKQVTGLKSSSVTATSAKLSWKKVSGAKYYKIEQSTDGKTWKTVATVSKNSASVKSLKAGTKYRFRVTALDSSKKLSGKASAVLKVSTLAAAKKNTVKASR